MRVRSLLDRRILTGFWKMEKQQQRVADHWGRGDVGRALACPPCFLSIHSQVLRKDIGGSVWRNWMTLENNLQAALLFNPPSKNACLLLVSLQWWDSDVVLSSSLPTGVAQHLVSLMWAVSRDPWTFWREPSPKERGKQTLKETNDGGSEREHEKIDILRDKRRYCLALTIIRCYKKEKQIKKGS